ncbi:restriction endonuclease PLD domain-containing protein [Lysinibacillus fusiformis]|uniref:restriction endonuclease PLD domain-containing protein n=1 Tax=Lysinibacillus fusiformis TaxID=28031 RepID=UPI0023A9390C|nr:restriction endonuclease PLD domain-containing protein [Lysinibacillus fusiformis]WEA38578.1 NgoFVII family restriction endonuclease [Lysinibacillus fusiformis]
MLLYVNEQTATYSKMLRNTGSLSRLFSESESPYLVSRSVENIYCEAFDAENLGRSDCSADAKYKNVGIGLKTFLHGNGRTLQKVAEFNRLSNLYRDKTTKELITTVAQLRNERIEFTKRAHEMDEIIYHCVTRLPNKILIFEEPMDLIDIKNIKSLKQSSNTITFEDGIHEYSFNITKSTLYKRFIMESPMFEIDVNILEHPYLALENLQQQMPMVETSSNIVGNKNGEYVILPLFSDRGSERNVPERSGLNQWNAKGRPRDPNEIYIPIPKWIHNVFPGFFPARDISFNLQVPSGKFLDAKVCQDGSKALMTNPNKALGEWLLREVMDLNERELLTYEMLEGLDIDSVIVTKQGENTFKINFCEIGTYDNFKLENDI